MGGWPGDWLTLPAIMDEVGGCLLTITRKPPYIKRLKSSVFTATRLLRGSEQEKRVPDLTNIAFLTCIIKSLSTIYDLLNKN